MTTAVKGQCGTCNNAKEFTLQSCPGAFDGGVICTSRKQAESIDNMTGDNEYVTEFNQYGFMQLDRLEVLVDEDYVCEAWEEIKEGGK